MKGWWMIGAFVIAITACTEGGNVDSEQQDESTSMVQSKEERQAEIAAMETEVAALVRSDRTEMLDAKADRLLKRYRDYIGQNPRDSITAEYLFKAADLSVGVGRYEGAIRHLDRLINEFPKFRKTAEMMLFRGFIYETYLNDYANAVKAYEALVKRFPNHRLAQDARASIDNLQLSEEELLEKFQKMNAKEEETAEN